MSEAKFTPGPWETSLCPNGGAILRRGGEEAWNHPQGMLQIVPAEDAYLIAAAPDMLAALKAMDAALCEGFDTQTQRFAARKALIAARAAIAKAEGRQP